MIFNKIEKMSVYESIKKDIENYSDPKIKKHFEVLDKKIFGLRNIVKNYEETFLRLNVELKKSELREVEAGREIDRLKKENAFLKSKGL